VSQTLRGPLTPSAGVKASIKEAFQLSWPITLSLLLHAGYRVNDQYWVKDLGPDAQAAMGLTSFLLILNFAFISLLSTGTLARIAKLAGAGNWDGLRQTFCTACSFALVWFGAIAVAGWFAAPMLVRLSGGSGAPADLATDYLGTIYLVLPMIGFKPLIDGVFFGLGNTFVPMCLSVLSVVLNAILNPVMIYGWWGFPALGIEGAAWSTGISRAVSAGVGILVLLRWFDLGTSFRQSPTFQELKRICRIGGPVAFSHTAYALCFTMILKTSVAPLGASVQAGLAVGFNGIESLSYCGMMGPAMAAASLVGRRLGAHDYRGAKYGAYACMSMSVGFALCTSIIFLTAGTVLSDFYTDDATILAQAVLYLNIVAFSQVMTAADSTMQQIMAGAGRTLHMAMLNTIGFISRVPLAWWMSVSLGFGASGIWWALNIANFLKLGAIFMLFRRMRIFSPLTARTDD
jgi:putative MATE family efflux protein